MKKLRVYLEDELATVGQYPVATTEVVGLLGAKPVQPQDYGLWLCLAELAPGAELRWSGGHGDEGLHVVSGDLTVDGRLCPAGGAVIIESGVETVLRSEGGARVVHVGPAAAEPPADAPLGPPAPSGHGVHVVGPAGWYQSGSKDRVEAIWFADATCPTCRISFFTVRSHPAPFWPGPAHSHSQDEIIHVLEGTVRLGAREYGPGTTLCVPADVHYALSFGENGALFTNFRRSWSEQTFYERGKVARIEPESGLSRGGTFVGQVETIAGSAVTAQLPDAGHGA